MKNLLVKPHLLRYDRVILLLLFLTQSTCVLAQETIKAGVQYSIPKNQKIELRITKIPKKLPWLERDDEGKVEAPEEDSVIVAQNIEAIEITDEYGTKKIIPQGTKFYAKVLETSPAKSFWRKGKAKLEFFAIDPYGSEEKFEPDYSMEKYNGKDLVEVESSASQIKLEGELSYNSKGTGLKESLTNLSGTGGYALAGAIAAPFIIFSVTKGLGNLFAFSAITNPYVLGGTAAVGASAGLAYGIMKKGKTINLEPGSELIIELANPWLIVSALEDAEDKKETTLTQNSNKDFLLEVLEVKKKRDEFDDQCLMVSINYENKTNEELRYSSFQLVDSMGKEYEPSISSFDHNIFGELPRKGNLKLFFNVDFPKTLHQLRALRVYDQKALATVDVVLP